MFFHFAVFLHSLLFFLGLEAVLSDGMAQTFVNFFNKHGWLALFLLAFLFGYIFQTAYKFARKKSMTTIPLLLAFAVMVLVYFIHTAWERHAFAFLTSTAYYFLHIGLYRLKVYDKDKTARAIVSASALATIFLFYAGMYGIYFNFDVSLWILMLIFFLATVAVSYQYFSLIARDGKELVKYSLLLGFVMLEVVWAINFWPFGYLTTGVITLIFYYVFWDMVQAFMLEELSKKRLATNILTFSFVIALVLLTSRWVAVV